MTSPVILDQEDENVPTEPRNHTNYIDQSPTLVQTTSVGITKQLQSSSDAKTPPCLERLILNKPILEPVFDFPRKILMSV
jgi:hypothetical protein